ncbi:DNA-3-methyladenine glycosylase [Levilactobacillus tujiorum]|uniref:Putative 3-methyladenine DNA glycosylase n=1 Tax=Levilactobacillus tujiorum TaxID=2912243 RepID=A0ABX1L5K5_9LACO|nr:DNA-3-methyladenine glycosylase [Levilactobacillus tujiorum]MCH5464653.1 DNA-3-methyladenine glycosylase [Levilactobacillus tujiorum]NLR11665.1 DNA-3-methyladenine glycosylase [Lactobacillus sp. HBUAS51387]NLR29586.1 DNA-3-methyladenine glycosylase [Levilactobacillus tujiorum]
MSDSLADFFTGRPTPQIAQELLGHELVYQTPAGTMSGWIVEAEAYLGEQDTAAHAFNGRYTAANAALYDAPGTIYIYILRGYYMFDVATQAAGTPQGILIRGIEPHEGLDLMQRNRDKPTPDVTNGPGKLMAALGIQSKDLNRTMLGAQNLTITPTATRQPKKVAATSRVGVSAGSWQDRPLRFTVAGNPFVSGSRKRDWDRENHGWV